jgi:hypothetical protein
MRTRRKKNQMTKTRLVKMEQMRMGLPETVVRA